VYAPAAGRVVSVHDGARDHLSRSSWLAYSYMIIEGMFRELAGSRFLLGNHLVVDIGEGCFAALAHLKRGSITVRSGEDIASGQPVAQVGNSGNSTEPHLHFQLMDGPHPATAAGLPFAFRFTGVR
jgi:murein DD-endopeptidase MepM/ murein hydrolase activator NlpD